MLQEKSLNSELEYLVLVLALSLPVILISEKNFSHFLNLTAIIWKLREQDALISKVFFGSDILRTKTKIKKTFREYSEVGTLLQKLNLFLWRA